jgi:mycothiol S-conjugate amidase
VAEYFPQRDAALRAHATQIDPDGFFFAAPRELEAEVWPVEEFEIALSRVEVADDLEDDLFAGVVADGLPENAPIVHRGADFAGEAGESLAVGTGHGSDDRVPR